MRLPLPGPATVVGGAVAAADAVQTALGLVPRAADAMSRVEALLERLETLADRTDQVVTRADEATQRASSVVGTAELVTRDASRTVDGAKGVLDRADRSLQAWEPSLRLHALQGFQVVGLGLGDGCPVKRRWRSWQTRVFSFPPPSPLLPAHADLTPQFGHENDATQLWPAKMSSGLAIVP